MSAFSSVFVFVLLMLPALRADETVFARPIPVSAEDVDKVLFNQGRLVLAMNVGDGRETVVTTVNTLPFQGGGRQGLTQSQTRGEVTMRVVVDYHGQHDNGLAIGLYPNDTPERTALFQLLNSGFVSGAGRGSIEIHLGGLTPGRRYRLQSLHLWNTGGEGSREMLMRLDGEESSPAFEQIYRGGEVVRAVSMSMEFTATRAQHQLELSPKDIQKGIDRSYLNGLILFDTTP